MYIYIYRIVLFYLLGGTPEPLHLDTVSTEQNNPPNSWVVRSSNLGALVTDFWTIIINDHQ